ncbi:tRNA 2-thiouridine(34) synthase MnmA [Clostridium sp. D2Q-11]|uniref:tRNA-specific 2-thiouridylase MnmA n=1 Tax=Anaeromonas frigoriresistens TaxID=2683708 RepID=A0A942UVY1_9FIRM|nr:tRNA 2-thiouridine(34) synthase MnmA [Anaeromonas frigoriresistens]MBS4540048.1 tRNA 2-thiouridine(34) synthase MnmA [Anaeromonas frigoriresistens]
MDKKKVVIGMSGGVDSSVAAYLLKEQGYNVIGVTMQIWQDNGIEKEGGCCSLSAVEDARMVANKLDIPFYVMNFKDIFKKRVIDYFIDEYGKGRTPNPCIACNRYIKFEELLKRSNQLGAYYVATGHYGKIEYDTNKDRYILKKSDSDAKDQSYALYNMTQEQLKHTLMPLGNFDNKEKVRDIARELGLIVADKKDSQEICFVEDDNYSKFIQENADYKIKSGNFIDINGNTIGKHKGITNYTIGQRKGLGLALGKPAYVTDIDAEKNQVIIGDNSDVYGKELIAEDINLISIDSLESPLKVKAKIRYNSQSSDAYLIPIDDDKVKIIFDESVRAITSGQSVVFYDNDVIVGGGTILKKLK